MPEEEYDDDQSRYPQTQRGTQYVDDILDSYGDEDAPPPPVPQGQPQERVADWARNNSGKAQGAGISRNPSYGSSGAAGGSGRGGSPPVRKQSFAVRGNGSSGGGGMTSYQGSEAGYAETTASYAEMVKIRVKLHHASDTRGMVRFIVLFWPLFLAGC